MGGLLSFIEFSQKCIKFVKFVLRLVVWTYSWEMTVNWNYMGFCNNFLWGISRELMGVKRYWDKVNQKFRSFVLQRHLYCGEWTYWNKCETSFLLNCESYCQNKYHIIERKNYSGQLYLWFRKNIVLVKNSQIPNYEYIKIARVVKIVGKLSGFEVDLKIALLEWSCATTYTKLLFSPIEQPLGKHNLH